MRGCVSHLQGLIAASDLNGEGYVDMDEFLAAMVANSSYSKTKDAVSGAVVSAAMACHLGQCIMSSCGLRHPVGIATFVPQL
jgi:hypothetical protein